MAQDVILGQDQLFLCHSRVYSKSPLSESFVTKVTLDAFHVVSHNFVQLALTMFISEKNIYI